MVVRLNHSPSFRKPSLSISRNAQRKLSSGKRPPCSCDVSNLKISQSIINRQLPQLKTEMAKCQYVKDYKGKWDAYQIGIEESLRKEQNCKAFQTISQVIRSALIHKKNVLEIDEEVDEFSPNYLYIFISAPGEVTLAGEGGKYTGQKIYWTPLIEKLRPLIHKPICIISIGGGVGYDGIAISNVFKQEGFKVLKPMVVDPNPIAALLANEDEVEFSITISQNFFAKFFRKSEGNIYLVHLGTTLNVVNEDSVVEILKNIALYLNEGDILSIIMVDEKQFKMSKDLEPQKINAYGIRKYTHKKTGIPYKTVIGDLNKFSSYLKTLGLEGSFVSMPSQRVAFIAYKAFKTK